MQHSESEIESRQRSLGIDEVHVEQVGTVFVQDGVEGQPVVERPRKVGDGHGRTGSGNGLSAPGQERSLQIRERDGFEHLVELVAEHQVPDQGQGHLGISVDDVGSGNVDQ